MEIKYDTWVKIIKAKTNDGIIMYFANNTDKQFWWDIDLYYAAFNISESMFHYIKRNIIKKEQVMFDETTEVYSLPINIVEMEFEKAYNEN